MLTIDLFEEFEGPPEPTLIDALRDFLPIAVKHLKIKKLPKIKLLRDVETEHLPSFGKFKNDDQTIDLGIKNRHPNDILRTLAHELTHYAQSVNNQLDSDSGATGSPEEDQANAEAGVVMRKFNQQFPQYMALKPIVFETADYERDMQSDPSNPIPFPPGTTLVNVSDVYDWYKLGMAVPALGKADPRIFNKGVPHTVFAFGTEEEEHRMVPLLKRLGFTLHDIDKPEDYAKAIRASDVVEHLEQYVAEKWSKKYKKSINCSNPKGFSQKAHCAGRKKHTNEAENRCPPATQDIGLNLKNRQKAINEYGYGPLNPLEPNVKFWAKKQEMWQLDSINDAKKSLCGNCAAFDVSKDSIACIEKGIGQDSFGQDPHDVVEAGELGYCRFLKFKCASLRTCDAWVVGGPIIENFADGKGPGRPGDSQRHGIPKGATMAQLEKAAKAPGRKGQLARWQINMRRGKKK